MLVGPVTDGPQGPDQQHQGHAQGQRATGDPPAPPLHLRVAADQATLGESHGSEQPLDEIAAPATALACQVRTVQAHALGHAADQPVDGAAFLGAAGEIHTAQQRPRLEGVGLEDAIEEPLEVAMQGGELLHEAVDQVAPGRVALLLQAFDQALAEALLEQPELVVELRQRAITALLEGIQREGHAPHLGAFVLAQVVEKLHEARYQVELGQHQVYGEAHAQLAVQLLDARTDRRCVCGALGVAAQQQVRQADGDERTVDRAARALGLEQVEEAQPGRLVDLGVAVLGGVAAGSVEQHRLVGEPPVAVARAADTADGALAQLRGQREVQARIDQRGGLARTGRADDHVPRQLVEVAPFVTAQAGLLQQGQCFVHALAQG
ncbi:hypothetical protein D3C79_546940 [compost metagenome]